ncbi:bacteriorhodopsin [Natrialba swarupiae]|uniref:Rhodopsin n=1 Tax=Natrialba swarupiae TaxID=2448032 RepID=A0A5D5AHQ7_9EURY|nr:bacteriorhodopsin [Natrialba swarupiae]TYT60654.1 rhodopsin [Natrialba swarupiae]
MFEPTPVYAASGVVYAIAFVVFLSWSRRLSPRVRRMCHVLIALVGIAAFASVLNAAGVGVITYGAESENLPDLIDDLLAYSLLCGLAGALAGASRQLVATLVAVVFLMRASFAAATFADGIVAIGGVLVVIVGYAVVVFLFAGRVWENAEQVSDRQRLLHWKARNLFLFLFGMLIVFGVAVFVDLLDPFVTGVVKNYIDVLFRVGFAGFLFANASVIEDDTSGALLAERAGGEGGAETTSNAAT